MLQDGERVIGEKMGREARDVQGRLTWKAAGASLRGNGIVEAAAEKRSKTKSELKAFNLDRSGARSFEGGEG